MVLAAADKDGQNAGRQLRNRLKLHPALVKPNLPAPPVDAAKSCPAIYKMGNPRDYIDSITHNQANSMS
ncbi:MAG: hypothetical protein DMG38_24865 [Acidobacteria bacterium]|nr:MAG: hypothetical protein DMG38_24865 [Acidobacteriota bacterium]